MQWLPLTTLGIYSTFWTVLVPLNKEPSSPNKSRLLSDQEHISGRHHGILKIINNFVIIAIQALVQTYLSVCDIIIDLEFGFLNQMLTIIVQVYREGTLLIQKKNLTLIEFNKV